MPLEVFADNPQATVAPGSGATAPASGTAETWVISSGAATYPLADPTATPPTRFRLADIALPSEQVLVTDSRTTSWAVTRGAGGTTPVAHASGFTIRQVMDSATLAGLAGLRPSNDTTGVADTAAIKDLLSGTAATCLLGPGKFYYNATLTGGVSGALRGPGWGACVLQAVA